ncbi:hypothetical protein MN116_001451 [Schistosoma mekongi]|uniref:Uncharacterized protein n=1 Tax=Schistosoma mekongi TaxID=38744 RepID=A0AAE2D9H5_SCHME|nr:hypothetical protein MN116_001451 [Schistosoma mekongi]
MGNCIFAGKKLFSQCYNHFGQSRKSSPEFDCLIGKNHRVVKPCRGSRNTLNEYISRALSHSHSPLVFDDSLSRSSISSHFDESSIPISSSWVSDGARSDASHILYKELDPLNRTTSVELDKECGATFYKEGSWITVAEPSNAKYVSSSSISHYIMPPNTEQTSACMHRDDKRSTIHPFVEEVDGLELARLARRLWHQNKTKHGKSACSNEKVGIKSHSKPAYLERPTVLKLRSTPQTALPPVTRPTISKDIYFESPDMDSAFDLAWDHEMDLNISNTEVRRPYNKHVPQCNISPNFNNESHTNQFATHNRLLDAKQKSLTTVNIHDSSFSQTSSVTILPVRNDNLDLSTDNRWVPSERLPGNARSIAKKPIMSETAIPCSDLFVSPTYNVDNRDLEYSTTSKVTPRLGFADNLFDSGFVGGSGGSNMISSFSDFDDTDDKVIGVGESKQADNLTTDLPTDHSSDFLWEHELFIPQMCYKTKDIRFQTTV